MKLQLEIELTQTGNGGQVAVAQVKQLGKESEDAQKRAADAAKGHTEALRNLYVQMVALREGVKLFADLARRGIEFNSELQKSQLLFAALITNYQTVRNSQGLIVDGAEKFNVSMGIALQLQERLREQSLRTGLAYQDLDQTARLILGTTHGQVRDMESLVELSTKLTKAGTVMNQGGGQFWMMREVRALMSGNQSELATMLGISPREITQARATGDVVDLLNRKLEVYMATSEKFRQTVPGAWGALKNAVDQALGEGTAGQMGHITELLNELTKQLVTVDQQGHATFNPEFVQSINAVADAFVQVGRGLSVVAAVILPVARGFTFIINTVGALGSSLLLNLSRPIDNAFKAVQTAANGIADLIEKNPRLAKLFGFEKGDAASIRGFGARAGSNAGIFGETLSGMRDGFYDAAANSALPPWMQSKPGAGRGTIGAGPKPPLDEALERQRDALKERITLETTVLGIQGQQLQQEQQKAELTERLAQVDRQLATEKLRVGGIQLNQTTQQLILQDRMLRMRQADLDAAIALTTEDRKHAEELAKIDKDRRANQQLAGKDPRAAVSGSLFDAAQKAEDDRHAAASEKIAQDAQTQRDKARADNKQLARETFDDARKLTDERIRQEDTIYGLQAEHVAKIEGLYQDMIGALQGAEVDALTSVLQHHSITAAIHSFADNFAEILARQLTSGTDDWFDRLRRRAAEYVPRLDENGRPVTGSDGRPVMTANPAFDPRARSAMQGLQAASLLYGLYSAGQGGMSRGQGAASGGLGGGMLGFTIGSNPALLAATGGASAIIGAVIGGIVGAIAGALSGKDKNWFNVSVSGGKVNVTGSGGAHAGDVQNAVQQINAVVAQGVNSIGDIFGAFPIAIAQGMKSLSPADLLKQAGTRHFDDKTLQTFLSVELPKMILEAYLPSISGGLTSMGISQSRINQIFATAKGKNGSDAFAFIRDYIAEFVKLQDFVDFVGKSGSGKMAAAIAEAQKTTPQKLSDLNDRILLLTRGFGDLTNDEQLTRVKQINELTGQRYQLELQYLQEINETAKTVHKSVTEQIFGMQMADYDRPTAMLALNNSRSNIIAQIGKAKTPAEIAALAQQYQQLTGQLYDFAVAVRNEFKSLLDGFADLAARPGKDARAGMLPQDRLRAINDEILKLADNFSGLTSEDQLTKGRQILDLANEAYEVQKSALEQIKDLSTSISRSIEEQIFSIQQDQRNPQDQLDALLGRQRDLYAQLQKANSADEVNFIIGQIQKNTDTIYGLEGKNPTAAANAISMLSSAGDLAQKKLHDFGETITNSMNGAKVAIDGVTTVITKSFTDASAAVTALQGDLLALDDAVQKATSALRDDLGDLDKALDPLTGVLDSLKGSAFDLGEGLDSTGDSLDRFRERIDAINEALGQFGGFVGAAAAQATTSVEKRQYQRARAATLLQRQAL
jgi:ABC-type transporter Mla subunit MlaD